MPKAALPIIQGPNECKAPDGFPAGKIFGDLTVEAFLGRNAKKYPFFRCRCKCGTEVVLIAKSLTRSKSPSRRCKLCQSPVTENSSSPRHEYHALFQIWKGMLSRCTKENAPNFRLYGGRGIGVCERWMTFNNFAKDMGFPPDEKRITIDRINNDGNYEPGNVRWASVKEQAENRRTNRHVYINNEKFTQSQASVKLGITPSMVRWAALKITDGTRSLKYRGVIFSLEKIAEGDTVGQHELRERKLRKRLCLGD